MPLQKPSGSLPKSSTGPPPESLGVWGKKFPAVCEFLSSVTWADGTSRELGSVILFFDLEDGKFKACLSCKDTRRVAFVSGADPEAVLGAAQRALESDKTDWRAAKGQRKAKGP